MMTKKTGRKGKDVLDDLGGFIEAHFKKGVNKVEEIFKDNKAADDKFFSYFKAFVDDKGVAAVTPSSKFLVDRVVRAMDLQGLHIHDRGEKRRAKVVVEYGPADGVISRHILERLPKDGILIAIELNDQLFLSLKSIRDPRLKAVHGDVRQVAKILKEFGFDHADVIVSGIPFAFLSGRGRHELLLSTSELLSPGGRFVAYQVTTHLIPLLKDYFRRLKTEFEVRNIPPHFVFTSFK